jgi:hypothetical protein
VFHRLFPISSDRDDEGVADALQDLGELGFVVGYLISQFLGVKALNASGYVAVDDDGISSVMVALLLVWVIFSKINDYRRATNRVQNAKYYVPEAYYVQMA